MSCKLNDVCELIVDCPHSTEPDEGEGYPIIRTPNIGVGYLDLGVFNEFPRLHTIGEIFAPFHVRMI